MNLLKLGQWTLIFGLLAVFTFSVSQTVFAGSGGPKAAAVDLALQHPGNPVIVAFSTVPEANTNGLTHVLANHVVCSVSQAQFDDLKAEYDASLSTITADGATKTYVTLSGRALNPQALQAEIGAEGCKVVKHANIFYLIFSGSLS